MSGENSDIVFKVWDNSGSGGYPGDVIATSSVAILQILDDVIEKQTTEVVFEPPVQITGPFYPGVVLPQTEGDCCRCLDMAKRLVSDKSEYRKPNHKKCKTNY